MNIHFIRRTDKIVSLILLFITVSLFCSVSVTASAKESSDISLTYTVRLHMIRDDLALHVRAGDSIIDAVGKYNIGKITDIRYEKCTSEVFSHKENRNVISEYEGYCDIVLTVSATAKRNERGYSVSGYALRLGKEVAMRLPDFYGVGRIVSIDIREGAL